MRLRGRVVIGAYAGVRTVKYGPKHEKAGEEVDNLRELILCVGDGEEDYLKLGFFASGFNGVTAAARSVEAAELHEGDLVAVSVTLRTSLRGQRAYVNEDVVSVEVLERAEPKLRAVAGGAD
jgi:hypothetical protein